MRDPKRIDRIVKRISVIWKQCPDMRWFQLQENLLSRYSQYKNSPYQRIDSWNLEDSSFEDFLNNFKGF